MTPLTTLRDRREQTSAQLPPRERLLDAIIAAEPECVKLLDIDGALQMMNPAGLRMIEADSFDQVCGVRVRQIVAEEDRAAFDNLAARVFSGESGVLEFRITGLKGTARWIEMHAAPLYDEERRVTALLSISRDVTDRRRTLDALRQQEANFRALFEQATEGIFVFDERLRFTDVNSAACQITGYPREELLAIGVSDLILPEDRSRLPVEVERLGSGAPVTSEWRIRRHDGHPILIEVCATRLPDGRVQAFVRDITSRSELQLRLLQSQKMESIGRLAGGIAHDFNNLLTVISGTAELALMTAAPDNPLRAELEHIQLAAERGSTLTGQLLAMSRQQILQPEVLDLNAVLRTMDGMLRRLIGEDIGLVMTLPDEEARVRADPNQLEQVILNVVLNARDAMPDGGTITVETRLIDPATNWFAQPPSTGFRGPHVMLAIGDTGVGMDEATRRRIFDPFFTTKALGAGAGLGLSTVYGTVEQSGGAVVAESEPGAGTVIRIYLPWMADDVAGPASSEEDAALQGTETILLVEDELAIRSLTQRALEAAGYTVLAAGDGAEALDRLATRPAPIDLLLTDVVMPGMNGRELSSRIVKARPDVKVLYTSGYTDDAILRRGVLADPRCFIAKPYTPRQLQRKVREVLDS